MHLAEFLRIFHDRAPHIMWVLGAGASASAGIPTAGDMIWEFKRRLFCSEQRVLVSTCSDLGDPRVRRRIQRHFDKEQEYPCEDSSDEYAFYFERDRPSQSDRRRFLESLFLNRQPSYGHLCLAVLTKMNNARIIWTTNFDKLVEDASVQVFGSTGQLIVATLDTPQFATQALKEQRWPLFVKLHGDFHSDRLKNVPQELQNQDAELRRTLVDACQQHGLAVAGYSGRDESVMSALEEALEKASPFPFGLFWFVRPGGRPLQAVQNLISKSQDRGVQANIVEVPTFDELLSDLLLLFDDQIPDGLRAHLRQKRSRVSDAPLITPSHRGWPVIRFNALPVVSPAPTCRLVECQIGGTGDVRDAITKAEADVLAVRSRDGVLAFGSDHDVRRVFSGHGITRFDTQTLHYGKIRQDSSAHGLLHDALCRALVRNRPIRLERRGRTHKLVANPASESDQTFASLLGITGTLTGVIPRTSLEWREAARVRTEFRLGTFWFLYEPTIWAQETEDVQAREQVKEFIRRRLVKRYNQMWNRLLDAWAGILTKNENEITVRALGNLDGLDALFTLSKTTAFVRPEDRHGNSA